MDRAELYDMLDNGGAEEIVDHLEHEDNKIIVNLLVRLINKDMTYFEKKLDAIDRRVWFIILAMATGGFGGGMLVALSKVGVI